jgi:CBS domain containing-hemolysin-like protein
MVANDYPFAFLGTGLTVQNILFVVEVLLLVGSSAICSGLNIAFMSLDVQDLRRKSKLGNKQAHLVLPLRRKTYLVLAAILLTNVGAVSATSLVMERKFIGLLAGIFTTLLIVIFGEILPQAYFTRNSLAFCARFTPLMKLMVFVTYPVSKPLSWLLNHLFGAEKRKLESRHELGIMISEHALAKDSELDEDEVEIIKGALQLSEKRVRDIMTPIDITYWLTPDTVLTAETIDTLKANGYSRVPILNHAKTECFGILLVKQLVDIDFDERQYRVDDLPLHPAQLVGSMTALDTMFRKFIAAHSHLMPVERDDEIVGIVTIEDLIEEIIGHEIEDETDHPA